MATRIDQIGRKYQQVSVGETPATCVASSNHGTVTVKRTK